MGFFDGLFGGKAKLRRSAEPPKDGPEPSLNSDLIDRELISSVLLLTSTRTSTQLDSVYTALPNRYNPFIELQAGILQEENYANRLSAREHYIRGVAGCASGTCQYWNSPAVGASGQCLTNLICDYLKSNLSIETVTNLVANGYVMLSRAVQIQPNPFDFLRSRYRLMDSHGRGVANFTYKYLPGAPGGEVLCISDALDSAIAFATCGYDEDSERENYNAKLFHEWLDDMDVNGRNADEYSLGEIAEVGRRRHDIIVSRAEQDFLEGKFSVDEEVFKSAFL